MKIILQRSAAARPRRGFTLIELMISSGIIVLAAAALVYVNLLGQKIDELVNSSLGANDMSRLSFNLMMDEIRSSKNIQIGFGQATNFTVVTNGAPQQGNALLIIPSTNLNTYIWYFLNTNSATNDGIELCRYATGNTSNTVICSFLTNSIYQSNGVWLTNFIIFQAFDYTGTNLLTQDPTNYTYNYVIGAMLQFAQYQYPLTVVGSNYMFDRYQLTYQATRRTP